ncbi:MAG TPA: multicopper oxidase domain-containing protein [Acidimicrobiia bacterium]|jgi:nitrite reductase (NO-forming)
MAVTTSNQQPPASADGERTSADGNGRGPATATDAPRSFRPYEPITDRAEIRWWTGAVTLAAFAAMFLAVIALVKAHNPSPAKAGTTSAAPASSGAAAASSVDFDATPGAGFHARDPNAPAPLPGTVHNIDMHIKEVVLEVAPGVKQMMWTFDGQVPGPIYRGHVGDTFNFKITNDGTMTHSLDFHAGMVSPNTAMVPIEPGHSHTYTFRANHAGIFMYHCGTPPVLQHIGSGMYGALIIDPPGLPPVAHEYVLVQSELYTGANGDVPDYNKLLSGNYDAVMFNGYVNQYKFAPIHVAPGDRVRVWVMDDGPSDSSSFHVIGTIFDTVYKEGAYLLQPGPGQGGSQALDLAPAQGGFVEFTPSEPGSYTFVTHKFNDAVRGALGVFHVGDAAPMSHS